MRSDRCHAASSCLGEPLVAQRRRWDLPVADLRVGARDESHYLQSSGSGLRAETWRQCDCLTVGIRQQIPGGVEEQAHWILLVERKLSVMERIEGRMQLVCDATARYERGNEQPAQVA